MLTEVATSFVPVDAALAGPSVGDSFTFTAVLLAGQDQVGTSAGRSVTFGQEPGGDLVGFIVERLELDGGTDLAFGRYHPTGLQQRGEPAVITCGAERRQPGVAGHAGRPADRAGSGDPHRRPARADQPRSMTSMSPEGPGGTSCDVPPRYTR